MAWTISTAAKVYLAQTGSLAALLDACDLVSISASGANATNSLTAIGIGDGTVGVTAANGSAAYDEAVTSCEIRLGATAMFTTTSITEGSGGGDVDFSTSGSYTGKTLEAGGAVSAVLGLFSMATLTQA